MPRPPLFQSTRAQQAAVAVVMIGIFIMALVMAVLLNGATLGDPLAPLRQGQSAPEPAAEPTNQTRGTAQP